jgi:hypothetical protein
LFCAAALWAVLMPPDWGPEILPLVLLPETLVLAEGAEALAPPRGSETLFHTDRPLGAFGAKIALAARLGLINAAVEQSLPNLRRVRNAFAHSTSEVRLADPPYRDRLRESVALARRNLLWEPMQLILNRHMAERGRPARRRTILVAFLETGASTVRPLQPSLTMTLETGIRQRAGLTQ